MEEQTDYIFHSWTYPFKIKMSKSLCFVTMAASHPNNNHPEDIRNVFVIKRTLSTTALTKPPDCALNSSPQPAVFRSENTKIIPGKKKRKKKVSSSGPVMTFNGNKTVKRGIFPLDFNVQSYWSRRWVFWSDKGLANVILTGTWPYLSCEEKGNFLPFPKGNSGQTRGFNCKVFFLELDRKTYNKIHPHNAQTHSEKSTHPRVNKKLQTYCFESMTY